ncbi:MAG: DctP family TRAP transporter solute-binding subunit [Azospirillum sp.]|nr:DctP family TRAP transporter solute-binding subunit [Azospirillum sp.]
MAFVAAVALLSPASAVAREFRAADTQSADYPTVQALEFLGRLVAERSGGRHSVRVFHSRQLGEEKETIEQTRVGAIDLNRSNVAPFSGVVPTAAVTALPFLFRSPEHLHRVLDGPIGAEILAAFEPHGFIGLCFYDSGARSFYTRGQAIRTVADLKGRRIRVQQSDQMVALVQALGAVAVPLPYGQVGTALGTGIIDGAENNWPSYFETGHFRYAKSYTLTEHTMSPEVLVMSKKAWDELSGPDRAMFRQAAAESAGYMRKLWQAREQDAIAAVTKAGASVIEVDKQPFIDAMTPVYDRFVVSPETRDLVRRIQAVP